MRGILMIEALYNQTIKGLKTQTRRSSGLEQVNGCDATKTKPAIIANPDDWNLDVDFTSVGWFRFKNGIGLRVTAKPRYRVGEVMYLKEPVSTRKYLIGHTKENGLISETWGNLYKYSGKENHGITKEGMIMPHIIDKWSNKLFMPASAARAFIKITGIRCERLFDISEQDCVAEGIEHYQYEGWENYNTKHNPQTHSFGSPKNSFFSLYKFANKVKEVQNIWVWVYEFEYLKDFKV